ncbi:MAG: type II toxin-antitoxin system RelE/ParE family toxin [Terriglobia bacterium]
MKVTYRASFARDLRAIQNRSLLNRIRTIIESVEKAESLAGVPGLKKLQARGDYYRIRLGDYRIGLIIEKDTVTFVRVLHRREVYRYFP